MKKIFIAIFSFLSLSAAAQTKDDPVLMTINGKPVTRAEFEYSYNKNGSVDGAVEKKTVGEYVDMFINYKLKVAAAEEARMDTLSSFLDEFRQYRDLQLTPAMVDTVFIDSVARSLYDRSKAQLGGKDLLRPAHILLMVKQNQGEAEKNAAAQKADSIWNLLQGGADFEELARKFSQDPGSASKGGLLPWIGPGSVLKEFEDAAYALQVGQYSKPFLSPVGYHIVWMKERKQLEPYEILRPEIMKGLSRQGIEEVSAENKIKKVIDASGGRLTREAVMDSLLQSQLTTNPDLKYLVMEYHDGLLLYEVSKRQVWDVAATDEAGLEQQFKKNKKKYAWSEPRFKGFVYHCRDGKQAKAVKALLKKYADGDWKKAVKEAFNKDSVSVKVSGPYLCKKGENAYVDYSVFGGEEPGAVTGYPVSGVAGKKFSQPKNYKDVRSQVVNDWQEHLEKEWVAGLRSKYKFTLDSEVLKTVNNH